MFCVSQQNDSVHSILRIVCSKNDSVHSTSRMLGPRNDSVHSTPGVGRFRAPACAVLCALGFGNLLVQKSMFDLKPNPENGRETETVRFNDEKTILGQVTVLCGIGSLEKFGTHCTF